MIINHMEACLLDNHEYKRSMSGWRNSHSSEKNELFLDIAFNSLCLNSEDVESHGLGEGSALTDSHDITFSNTGECRGAVNGEVGVSLLKPIVLLDVMQVVSSDNNSSLHLGSNNDTPIM